MCKCKIRDSNETTFCPLIRAPHKCVLQQCMFTVLLWTSWRMRTARPECEFSCWCHHTNPHGKMVEKQHTNLVSYMWNSTPIIHRQLQIYLSHQVTVNSFEKWWNAALGPSSGKIDNIKQIHFGSSYIYFVFCHLLQLFPYLICIFSVCSSNTR